MKRFLKIKSIDKAILYYSALLCGCILFSIIIGNAYSAIDKSVANLKAGYIPTIIVDAGHGGEDGGAQGVSGILEKDINLKISKILANMFRISGFKVDMTRNEDISIYDDGAETLRQKKVSDLRNRLKLVNSNRNGILISIHQNKFSDSKYWGSQIFYSKNNSKSKELAEEVRKSIVGLIQNNNKREIKPCNKNVFLLWQSEIPSIIVECGFLSNKDEEKRLNDENYQQQMAFSIYCGFLQFWKNTANMK